MELPSCHVKVKISLFPSPHLLGKTVKINVHVGHYIKPIC